MTHTFVLNVWLVRAAAKRARWLRVTNENVLISRSSSRKGCHRCALGALPASRYRMCACIRCSLIRGKLTTRDLVPAYQIFSLSPNHTFVHSLFWLDVNLFIVLKTRVNLFVVFNSVNSLESRFELGFNLLTRILCF